MQTQFLSVILGLLFFALPSSGFADWSGTILIHSSKEKQEIPPGKVFYQGQKFRMEMTAQGRAMTIIVDPEHKTAEMLMPAQKLVLDVPASMADRTKTFVTCANLGVDECLKERGYKKTGSDTVDGHPCAVYEIQNVQGANSDHQKIWRPTDLKEVPMIKAVITSKQDVVTTQVQNIQVAKLSASLFQVPADYKKMQLPDFGAMQH